MQMGGHPIGSSGIASASVVADDAAKAANSATASAPTRTSRRRRCGTTWDDTGGPPGGGHGGHAPSGGLADRWTAIAPVCFRGAPWTASCSSTSPPGKTLARPRQRRPPRPRRAQGAEGRPRRDARPVRHRAAARASRPRHARPALPHGAAARSYEAVARFGAVSTTGDPEGEITETGTPIPEPLVLPTGAVRQRPPAHSAVKVGGERAYRLARRGEEVELPERDGHRRRASTRSGASRRACGWPSTARRGPTSARSSPTSATRTARSCGARRSGPFRVDDADPERARAARRGARPRPARGRAWRATRPRRAGHGVAVDRPGAGASTSCSSTTTGPIAVAEPREDALLKPTVGFRG